jgi:hypothetical protein
MDNDYLLLRTAECCIWCRYATHIHDFSILECRNMQRNALGLKHAVATSVCSMFKSIYKEEN